jgi:hypothetical protein
LVDTLYAWLMRCGNLACTGKPFTEHHNVPDLRPDPADPRVEWEQAADRVRAAIRSGQLTSGDTLPSVMVLPRESLLLGGGTAAVARRRVSVCQTIRMIRADGAGTAPRGGQSLISYLAAMFGVFGGLNADDGMPAGL